jgi:hypothetical protein
MSKSWIPRGPATRDAVCHAICEHLLHVLSSRFELGKVAAANGIFRFVCDGEQCWGTGEGEGSSSCRLPKWLTLQVERASMSLDNVLALHRGCTSHYAF